MSVAQNITYTGDLQQAGWCQTGSRDIDCSEREVRHRLERPGFTGLLVSSDTRIRENDPAVAVQTLISGRNMSANAHVWCSSERDRAV